MDTATLAPALTPFSQKR